MRNGSERRQPQPSSAPSAKWRMIGRMGRRRSLRLVPSTRVVRRMERCWPTSASWCVHRPCAQPLALLARQPFIPRPFILATHTVLYALSCRAGRARPQAAGVARWLFPPVAPQLHRHVDRAVNVAPAVGVSACACNAAHPRRSADTRRARWHPTSTSLPCAAVYCAALCLFLYASPEPRSFQ